MCIVRSGSYSGLKEEALSKTGTGFFKLQVIKGKEFHKSGYKIEWNFFVLDDDWLPHSLGLKK